MDIACLKIITYRAIKTTGTLIVSLDWGLSQVKVDHTPVVNEKKIVYKCFSIRFFTSFQPPM
jgi:hypothetical protein